MSLTSGLQHDFLTFSSVACRAFLPSAWMGVLPVKVIENQKTRAQNFDDETDMIDAFVACGGRMDKTGHVKRYTEAHTTMARK